MHESMSVPGVSLTLGNRLIQNLFVDLCFFLQFPHMYNSVSSNSSTSVKLLKQSGEKSRRHLDLQLK